ncbi:HAD hydrolase-like protein, partial [Lysinibacillus varians]
IKLAFFLTSKEIKEEFKQKGQIVEKYNADICPTHVVMGDLKEVFDYNSINTAFRYLDKGAKLILLQEGLYYLSDNEKNIDTGSFANIFPKKVQDERILIGKPSSILISAIMDELNIKDKKDFLIVGDDIFSDILMGNNLGIDTALVKTGKYNLQKGLSTSIKPNYLLESVKYLSEILEEI